MLRLDYTSAENYRDPAAYFERLRAAGPVVRTKFPIIGNVWITTTYELAGRVLKDSETFTLRKGGGAVAGLRWWMPPLVRTLANNMLTVDEPDHTRLRSIVDEAFRRQAILEMEPRISEIAEGIAAKLFAAGRPADLVERYARRVPLSVICELLGLPLADRERFMSWANMMPRIRGPLSFWRMLQGLSAMRPYLEDRIEAARHRGGEGLIAELVRVERDGGRITFEEMVAMVFLLLGAGSETTTHLISGATFELLKDPAMRDWLVQDWSRANLAVEEFLRFVSPVQFSKPRYVRKDVVLEGVKLKKGDKIMVVIAAANLDPKANDSPETLDLERHPNRHVAFGTGIHFCLGFQLARMEGKCALKALFGRWPKLALAVRPEEITWRPHPGIRAIAKLPVTQMPN